MSAARFLVLPSMWYEGFPLVAAESFACGAPVLCSRLGSLQEIVQDGRTGLHFHAGKEDLAEKAEWAWTHSAEMEEMGRAARSEYESKYTPECNYEALLQIYERAAPFRETHSSAAPPFRAGSEDHQMDRVNILGVGVSAINMETALSRIDGWIARGEPN
jgi:hypothetical protein